jgi:hypothetical protein
MFGEVLLGLFSYDGKLYKYDRVGGDARLIAVAGAPTGRAICMSDERHLFMFGCDGIPGLVRWSDREDYTVWTPLATNRAGGYELQVRSPFQCGVRVRGQILGLTKTEVFAFTPLQNALVYAATASRPKPASLGPALLRSSPTARAKPRTGWGRRTSSPMTGSSARSTASFATTSSRTSTCCRARSSRPASTRSSTKCGSSTARRVERSRPRRHLQLRRRDLEQGDDRAPVLGGPRRLPLPIAIDAAATCSSTKPARRRTARPCRRSSVAPHHHRHRRALRRRRPMVAGYAGRQRRGEGQLHLPRLAGRGPAHRRAVRLRDRR